MLKGRFRLSSSDLLRSFSLVSAGSACFKLSTESSRGAQLAADSRSIVFISTDSRHRVGNKGATAERPRSDRGATAERPRSDVARANVSKKEREENVAKREGQMCLCFFLCMSCATYVLFLSLFKDGFFCFSFLVPFLVYSSRKKQVSKLDQVRRWTV